VLVDN